MADKKALLIINPKSGTRTKAGLKKKVCETLSPFGISVTAAVTKYPGHATELTLDAVADGYDMVISAGGDGTVNEIASALAHSDTTLGIIPLGSGNGLARSLGIPQDVDEALKLISAGHIEKCDRGIVNGKPFYCTFGIGFDAKVSEKFASMKRRGRITYVQSVLQEYLNYQSQPYAISVDGEVITERAFLVAVGNASQYGNNAYIAPQAKLNDGLLDLIVIHDGSPLSAVKVGVDLLVGSLDKNAHIDYFKVKSAVISRLEEGAAHLDGEPVMFGKHLEISCDAGAINVFSPENAEEFKPIVSPLKSMIADIRYDVKAKINSTLSNINQASSPTTKKG